MSNIQYRVQVRVSTPRGEFCGFYGFPEETQDRCYDTRQYVCNNAHVMNYLRLVSDDGEIVIPGDILRRSVLTVKTVTTFKKDET